MTRTGLFAPGSIRRTVLLAQIRGGLLCDLEMMAVVALACSRDDGEVLAAVKAGLRGRDDLQAAISMFLWLIDKEGLL